MVLRKTIGKETKFTIYMVAILYATLIGPIGYSLLSAHVLLVGDYPHNTLNPTYGTPWIEASWASSPDQLESLRINAFNVIIFDPSATPLLTANPEINGTITAYLAGGGTLVTITSYSTTKGTIAYSRVGNGVLASVIAPLAGSYRSQAWYSSDRFWLNVVIGSVGYSHLQMLIAFGDSLVLVWSILALLLVMEGARYVWVEICRIRSSKILAPKDHEYIDSPSAGEIGSSANQHRTDDRRVPGLAYDHAIVIGILLGETILLFYPMLKSVLNGEIPPYFEGFLDVSATTYVTRFIAIYHTYPLLFLSRAYGQPLEATSYLRTSVIIVPVILSLLGLNPVSSNIVGALVYVLIGALALYWLSYLVTRSVLASLISSSVLYLSSSFLVPSVIIGGTIRYACIFVGAPLLLLSSVLIWSGRHRIFSLAFFSLVFAWFLGVDAIIATASGLATFTALPLFKRQRFRFILLPGIIMLVEAYVFYSYVGSFASLYPSTYFGINTGYSFYQTPSLLQALGLFPGMLNGMPLYLQSLGLSIPATVLGFLPLCLALVSLPVHRRGVLAFVVALGLLLLAAGVNGPFAFVFLGWQLPVRAPARKFTPVAAPLLALLSAIAIVRIEKMLFTQKEREQ